MQTKTPRADGRSSGGGSALSGGLFKWLHANGRLSHRAVGVHGLASTALGIIAGVILFPTEASLIGVVLVALSQASVVEALLDRNKDEIWGGKLPPRKANNRLAVSLFILFMGIFVTYVGAVQLAPSDELELWFDRQLGDFAGGSILDIEFGSFEVLFRRNILVLIGCFSFALFYRHGGMLLVLAWNASRWGVIFGYIGRIAGQYPEVDTFWYLTRTIIAILPHLVTEAIAYILIAMSGVFLSKAVMKYGLLTDEFFQVGLAVLKIGATAVAILVLAAALEAWLAPALVDVLFSTADVHE